MDKKYLVFFEYFATGEGRIIEISMIIATNETEARVQYLNKVFDSNTDDISVIEFESEMGKEIIFAFFKNAESLYEALKLGGREFHYKIHYNLS